MSNQEGKTKMEEILSEAKAAARILSTSTTAWVDAEDAALRPMGPARYDDLRALAQAKLQAAKTLLEALDQLDQ